MKNGTTISGDILRQNRDSVSIRQNGRIQTLKKSEIKRIKYGKSKKENGEREKKRSEPSKNPVQKKIKAEKKPSPHPEIKSADLEPPAGPKDASGGQRLPEKTYTPEEVTVRESANKNLELEIKEKEKSLLEKTDSLHEIESRLTGIEDRIKGKQLAFEEQERYFQKIQNAYELEQRRIAERARGFEPRISWPSMLWRSALIPGWGHYENGQRLTGATYLILFLAGAYGSYDVNRRIERYEPVVNDRLNYSTPGNAYFGTEQLKVLLGMGMAGEQLSSFLMYDFFRQVTNEPQRKKLEVLKNNRRNINSTVLLVYLFQLGHTFFSGKPVSEALRYGNDSSQNRMTFTLQPEPDRHGKSGGSVVCFSYQIRLDGAE